jgi:hypothetical protein
MCLLVVEYDEIIWTFLVKLLHTPELTALPISTPADQFTNQSTHHDNAQQHT